MFDQTFVDGLQKTKKPYAVVLSLLLQIGAIALLILAPLLYTQTLPTAQLKSMLMAPPSPPPPPRTSTVVKIRPTTHTRKFAATALIAPRVIPHGVAAVNEVTVAPNLGEETGVGAGTGNPMLFASVGPDLGSIPPPAPVQRLRPTANTVRVGGAVAEANLTRKVQPLYPLLAKSARVQGTVEFSAVISKEGRIEKLQLLHGPPLLANAAREAILQW